MNFKALKLYIANILIFLNKTFSLTQRFPLASQTFRLSTEKSPLVFFFFLKNSSVHYNNIMK